jgi:hypothetical protein
MSMPNPPVTHGLTPLPPMFPATTSINLSGDWTSLWNPISSQLGPVMTILSWAGVLIVVGGVAKWAWDRKKGMPGRHGGVLWALAIGALLAAPGVVIPIILGLADVVVNAIAGALGSSGG